MINSEHDFSTPNNTKLGQLNLFCNSYSEDPQ